MSKSNKSKKSKGVEVEEDECTHRCSKCKTPFLKKEDLSYHMKNVKCEERSKSDKTLPYFVCICDDRFKYPSSFRRHQPVCKVIKFINKHTEKSLNNMNMVHNGNGIIDKLKMVNNVDNSVSNIDNSVHAGVMNVIVQCSFPDNLSMPIMPYTIHSNIRIIATDELGTLSSFKINPYIVIFEICHCNPTRPLYHNIYYPQNGGNKISVYNGGRWEVKRAQSVIRDIVRVEREDYIKFFHDMANFTDVAMKEKMMYYINLFDPSVTLSKKEAIKHDKMLEEIHHGIISLLIEHRSLIEKMYLRTNIIHQLSDSSSGSDSESLKKSDKKQNTLKKHSEDDSDTDSESEVPKKCTKKNNTHKKHIEDEYDTDSEVPKKSIKKNSTHKKHIEEEYDRDSSSSSEPESPKKKSTDGIDFESLRKGVNSAYSSDSESDSAKKIPIKKCNKKVEPKPPQKKSNKKSTSDSDSEIPKKKVNKKRSSDSESETPKRKSNKK